MVITCTYTLHKKVLFCFGKLVLRVKFFVFIRIIYWDSILYSMMSGEEEGVQGFLAGQKVFLTGATGFVGMALVEKLLRTAPDLETIFLLVRPKRGKAPNDRLNDYIKNPVFQLLWEEDEEYVCPLEKLVVMEGDVGREGLGLSDQDRKTLVDQATIVIHSAATLDFNDTLKTTVDINLLGTKRVLELCHELNNLKVMLHVSSTYVNSHLARAEERLYPVHKTADEVITLVKSLSDEELIKETPSILGQYLNTYTFTKALAEHEVAAANSSFPTCIIRPSMIVASWREPMEGWTISKNGPQGFLMGALKGVIRRLPVDTHIICDYIPVDIVVNAIIVSLWRTGTQRSSETPIYQVSSSSYKPFKWNMVTDVMNSSLHRYPLKSAVWYPELTFVTSLFWFKFTSIFFHFIPAYFFDFITMLSGGRPILVKMHKNILKSLDQLEPFIFSEWIFANNNTMQLYKSMSPKDKEIYNLDISSINWEQFFDNLTQGVREYLHHEKRNTLFAARKKDKILDFLNKIVFMCLMTAMWFIFSVIIQSSMIECLWFVGLVGAIYQYI